MEHSFGLRADRFGAHLDGLRFLVTSSLSKQASISLQTRGHIRMVGSQSPFSDHQRAVQEPLRLGKATLIRVEQRQIVEAHSHKRMLGSEGFFKDRQRALEERLGLGESALCQIKLCQVVETLGHIGVPGPLDRLLIASDRLNMDSASA